MDKKFYKIVKPIVNLFIRVFFRPTIIGLDNIPKDKSCVIAGNHTKWLDPVMLVGITNRQIYFLAKDSLFKGIVGAVVKGMGAIPVNRKIHDKDALINAKECLKNNAVIGVFPEGTINRTNDIIMPFKIGAVKMSHDTDSYLVPFVITGKYKLFRKGIKIEFLKKMKISKDLDKENKKLEKLISNKLESANNEKR
ncbi:MAG: 1-acyl-sn-glycerol-3-phosphate acyltransferase [Bacilli bacterium]|nr:1-acyl-sn-glycerol-3-phosphate acyltransferase [Bacilli bacterium]MBR3049148.1 1-acyl-sn-glycerol-3-phosphate acyltransferase [Bacilli bacterium]